MYTAVEPIGPLYHYRRRPERSPNFRRTTHARFCNSTAQLGATHVEHPAHHGRAALPGTGLAKILDFPHPPNHAPYALFTLNPGLQGLLEFVGGFVLALGLFTRSVAFVLA